MSDIVYENLNKALMESYKTLNYEFIYISIYKSSSIL